MVRGAEFRASPGIPALLDVAFRRIQVYLNIWDLYHCHYSTCVMRYLYADSSNKDVELTLRSIAVRQVLGNVDDHLVIIVHHRNLKFRVTVSK